MENKILNKDEIWDLYFAELKRFKNKHGNLQVPTTYTFMLNGEERKLYSWIRTQRDFYKKGKIKKCRKEKLESLGFEFSRIEKQEEIWYGFLEALKKYKKTHGHMRVPEDYCVEVCGETRPLYSWMQSQRTYYKEKHMPASRIKALKSIGFDFAPHSKRWDNSFKKAKEAAAKGNMPNDVKYWVNVQRQLWLKGELSKARVRKMKSAFPDVMRTDDEKWMDLFNAVKVDLPLNTVIHGFELKNWLKNTKTRFNRGQLAAWQEEKLAEIGIKHEDRHNLAYVLLGKESFSEKENEGLEYAMKTLTDREREVIRLYYKEGLSGTECGNRFNLTRERIRQIQAKALRKLDSRKRYIIDIDCKHEDDDDIEALGFSVNATSCLRKAGISSITELEQIVNNEPEKLFDEPFGKSSRTEIIEKMLDPADSIKSLGLSAKADKCLRKEGIHTITALRKIVAEDPERLFEIHYLGFKTQSEIVKKTMEYGGSYESVTV